MKYLSFLECNNEMEWLDLALNCRKENIVILKAIKKNIIEKYSEYERIISDRDKKLPKSIFSGNALNSHKKVFIDLYCNPPKSLKKLLISRRREHSLDECPYCGNPTVPDTLDHFLPKEALSEYVIFPNNLIPQCRDCAPIKGSKYFSEDVNSVMFVHPIHSSLLETVIVKVSPSINENLISFDVKFSTTTTNDNEKNLLISHIKQLKIKERIQNYCYRELAKWKRKLKKKKFDIEAVLKTRVDEHPNNGNDSNWELVLYKSILENTFIIDHLKSITPDDIDAENNRTMISELDI